VDGSPITDSGAIFTAVNRFKIVLTLATYPLVTGPINGLLRISNGKSWTAPSNYWFDPILNLS